MFYIIFDILLSRHKVHTEINNMATISYVVGDVPFYVSGWQWSKMVTFCRQRIKIQMLNREDV